MPSNSSSEIYCAVSPANRLASSPALYDGALSQLAKGLGWVYKSADKLHRVPTDVLLEDELRAALIRLNPEIAERPERANEVLYRLRAILLSVKSDGLVRANEEFTAWLRGERSMPFGKDNEFATVRLVDFEHLHNNHFLLTNQLVFQAGAQTRRFDLVLFVNGIPLVIGEAKTPTRPAISWVDGAVQVQDDYEANVPAMFAPNVFSFATEGKTYRYGAVRQPLEQWAPWREEDEAALRRSDRTANRCSRHAASSSDPGYSAKLHPLRHR